MFSQRKDWSIIFSKTIRLMPHFKLTIGLKNRRELNYKIKVKYIFSLISLLEFISVDLELIYAMAL